MRWLIAPALAIAVSGAAFAAAPGDPANWQHHDPTDGNLANQAGRLGFAGQLAISRETGSFDLMAVGMPDRPSVTDAWPWASVTKQVVATLVMQQVEAGTLALDTPASRYLEGFGRAAAPTVRQLLRHQSGLRNPDKTNPESDAHRSFFKVGTKRIDWCLAGRNNPEADPHRYDYNNCDYIVLDAILEKVTERPLGVLFQQSIADPARLADTGFLSGDADRAFIGAEPDYRTRIPMYEGGAGLVGPLEDMVRFDRSLMDGTLLSQDSRRQLWHGDPGLDDMALGQWQYEVQLSACTGPVSIIERRGGIGKYALRNFILPAKNLVLILATQDRQFPFEDVRTGKGAAFELLSTAVCGAPE